MCAALSPAYWYNEHLVFDQVVNGDKRAVTFYLDWGTYEGESIKYAGYMKDNVQRIGYNIHWNIWNEGHSWGSWRAHIDEALVYFFGIERRH